MSGNTVGSEAEVGTANRQAKAETANDTKPAIDFKYGEAVVIYSILHELSKHRATPITVHGSNKMDRPTINVTLKVSLGDLDSDGLGDSDGLREYKGGRSIAIREKRNHETQHFSFEWIAPR